LRQPSPVKDRSLFPRKYGALGLGKPGKVNFVIDTDSIRLEAPRFTLESVFGSVEPVPGTSEDFDDEIEAAMAEEVDRLRIGGERR
jgi:hypothetical protein